MMSKRYSSPEFKFVEISVEDTIMSSNVENFSSYIDEGGDWGDPIIDPDDDIIW